MTVSFDVWFWVGFFSVKYLLTCAFSFFILLLSNAADNKHGIEKSRSKSSSSTKGLMTG